MSIVVDLNDPNNISQLFNLEKDWLVGQTILSTNQFNAPSNAFNLHDTRFGDDEDDSNDHTRSQQVERIHSLSQQLTDRPNRTCLSDIHRTIEILPRSDKKLVRRIIPSQSTLFELSQNKPDHTRWALTFQEEDEELASDDDGFQSASSSLSDSKLVPVDEFDLWSRAFAQAENKYFTWEQRGSYLYDRTRPFLFDLRLDDRPFQHLCLLLLFQTPTSTAYLLDVNYHPIDVDEFLRDLCYMLMGISSHTFAWNEDRESFELKPDVYVLGYTQATIERFAEKYIRAGNHFYAIKEYINRSSKGADTETEFCEALRAYLRYVQRSIAVHDVSKCSLVKFAAQLDATLCSLDLPLSLISTITELEQTIQASSPHTSVPFVKLSAILHTLLNHNYHTVDHSYFLLLVHLVTYALRPLLAFLTDLILHSNYLDRYNEYPILFHHNRLTGLKTTEFWTKTFTIRYLHANNTDTIFHQILPIEYLQQVVNITRSLLLIKLCDKNHPLCTANTSTTPQLQFVRMHFAENTDRQQIDAYQREMSEQIRDYEEAQKQKRLQAELAKVQERMEMYARQDQQRAERQKLADEERQRQIKNRQQLQGEWQDQMDKKRKQIQEEKLAERLEGAEFNKVTSTTTIIGSRLSGPYAKLIQNVREEIIAEYDAKMRDAAEREEQSRRRMQPENSVETPKATQPPVSSVSSASSLSFHTPAIDPSPSVAPPDERQPMDISPQSTIENVEGTEVLDLMTGKRTVELPTVSTLAEKPAVKHTANEETTQAQFRSGVKLVQSNVLKSTIQDYMAYYNVADEDLDEDKLPEKVYDWDAIIANGPQFKYEDAYDFQIKQRDVSLSQHSTAASWFDFDMSPLRVWLEHSISPLIHAQSQLVNRALLNYFFDELNLSEHLNHLRSYYFLATGRFGLAFCGELSRILLANDDAQVIYRVNTMRQLLYTALDQAGQLNHLHDIVRLTAKADTPSSVSLLDATLLDYFDLTYMIQWPLNIVVSHDMLEKYKVIFRFLLRILIVKQVLNEIWIMLKGCKQRNPALAHLHQYRHQMQHFMTVLSNYISNQVIQVAWNEFMRKIHKARHINEIAAAHNEYLDRTMLNCLLTPNAMPILNEVNRVLTLIIRFRCQLKTFAWILDAKHVDQSDTSIQALRTTFEKYHIAVLSLFKVLSKLVEKGYKTSLGDLLIRLNHNGYYHQIATSAIRAR